ncbi:UDP-3-O-(3-hydroxymyristoyl)glucosamine N-acyltransferase [Bordetella sp. FB-8]|uniref:UDP-3-O-(3-hydroxymyristoyl)glucosamine N-acyltransferase n=1 Tax=Bordetella sp. FB-8 TaxID=1159870 RepID=UPI00035F2619|nr:UDP-3-O-(3-hydroxymyristoyl)glucosamine N-acyltransferase [Bordetella sp. FB-8]
MSALLDPAHAPTLDELLAGADTQGLNWRIVSTDSAGRAGQGLPQVCGIGTLSGAGSSEISFLTNKRYQSQLLNTKATAVIVPEQAVDLLKSYAPLPFALVVSDQPYLLYARLAQWFDAARRPLPPPGVHPTAVVACDAHIEDGVSVGPHCVIESGVQIGRGTILGPGCVIGQDSSLGPDCRLHARVTLYHGVTVGARAILHSGVVLGADGFGFAPDPTRGKGAWGKIPQLGGVTLGDDVEVGANTTIDRGALEDTQIADDVKLDNLIMIAHNVRIGAHTAIAGCVAVAGSAVIGERCIIGGSSAIAGHITIADDVTVSGKTGIFSSIAKPGHYTSVYPYSEHAQWQRNAAVIPHLADLRKRLRALEKKGSGAT